MALNRQQIQRDLKAFDFENLFVEALGWDHLKEPLLSVTVKGQTYTLHPLVEKRGVKVYVCDPDAQEHIPDDTRLRQIDREVTKYAYEHIIIYVDATKENQVWQWVKREQGKPLAPRVNKLHKSQSGDALAQKLTNLAFEFSEEEGLTTPRVSGRVAQAFDVERVTKRFYDRFQKEHGTFLKFIQGITAQGDREWYTSLMLNRLMFIYFIQRQGFLDTKSPGKLDGDIYYLRNRLEKTKQQQGPDTFHSFYRYFLLTLFHDGLSKRERSPELEKLLGRVPYLNGGLFDVHQLERANPDIQIPDEAFERIFDFFDEFDWHLDDRPNKTGNEINPDVLGYIFEKYINQKQMGAYYTKEDITGYISKNTILPYLFEAAEKESHISFSANGPVWSLLRDNPDRYIYAAVKKGAELPLPPEIAMGLHDIAKRTEWNKPALIEYALPTEIWREVVARRTRYEEVRAKLATGEVTSINDLITYNLDIRQFAQDVITYCEGPELLLAFYEALAGRDLVSAAYQPAKAPISILDPTCGSGAFLFAALNILEPLYEACLDRMQIMVDERDQLDAGTEPARRQKRPRIESFRAILQQVAKHHNREYFILKSIIINNLYGVDIMEEATEICKLRLFLKLVAQVQKFDDIEPLPDIDFNIRTGNTLIGFANLEDVSKAVESDMLTALTSTDTLARILQKVKEIERDFEVFRKLQTQIDIDSRDMAEYKQQIRMKLDGLRADLDPYLAAQYGVDRNNITKKEECEEQFKQWQQSHQPFHWFAEFYGIMKEGGFDIIIGNPPYVEYGEKLKAQYRLFGYVTLNCGNLHAYVAERALHLAQEIGRIGLIVPLPAVNTSRMEALQKLIKPQALGRSLYVSAFDERPSSLFVGVDQRLIVEVFGSVTPTPYLVTTGINRWASSAREPLFELLSYSLQPSEVQRLTQSILKTKDNRLESRMLALFYSNRTLDEYKSNIKSQELLAYRTAGGRYWKVVLDHPFDSESLSNKVAYLNNLTGQQAVSLISSSTFWWYYSCHFDMYNLKDYMIFGFKFSRASRQTLDQLQQLGTKLVESLMMNSTTETIKSKTRGFVTSRRYVASKSKPIIDEIDCVLAEHYGFTDEELDFIINYDIKYRMGRDSSEDDGE